MTPIEKLLKALCHDYAWTLKKYLGEDDYNEIVRIMGDRVRYDMLK